MSRYRDLVVTGVLVVTPFVFFVSNNKDTRNHNAFDRVVVWISAPVQYLVVGAIEGISSTWQSYVALVGVKEENQRLEEENARLRGQLASMGEIERENERLRVLVEMAEHRGYAAERVARIVAVSPSPLFRSVRVDRGSRDGVHRGAAVVNHDGVVGRVAAVGHGYADVMLLVDANSSVDAVVQRTRARARVYGAGRDHRFDIEVRYLTRTADVEPGDMLVTSGIGSTFPKGLAVGRVTGVERGAFGLYQRLAAEPTVDFTRLEEVLIMTRTGLEGGKTGRVAAAAQGAKQEVEPGPTPSREVSR